MQPSLNIGYPGSVAFLPGWWLVGTYQPAALFGDTALVAWFDWLPEVDTPLGLFGDVIGFYTGLPSVRAMIASGFYVPAMPGDVPWE